jgi:uncharacterized protein (TIGR02246 family)
MWAAVLAVAAATVTIGFLYRLSAQEQKAAAEKKDATPNAAEVAAVRKTAEEYARAFNKGDARALANLWTRDGEYAGPDGESLRGREAIMKAYKDFFKKNPQARVEVKVESVRVLGRQAAMEEGTLKLHLPGEKEPEETRYSVLHVLEKDGWRMATVREWVPDEAERDTLKDLEWLVGEWEAKSDDTELRTRYTWDEGKVFLECRYTLKQGGKVIASGRQIIGKDPAGGLRSWLFDNSGSFGESVWTRDEDRWMISAGAVLPDGSELTATNILIPLGKDAFTWQSVERTAGDVELPDLPPVKVTRVKPKK